MRKVRFKDVVFTKCHDFNSFGEYKPFWRADLYGQTIATLCDTKAECVAEVRNYLKKRKEENYELQSYKQSLILEILEKRSNDYTKDQLEKKSIRTLENLIFD